MASILTKDKLRQSVEAATEGNITVLYDMYGNPSYMYVIEKFNKEDVDPTGGEMGTGTHPAFIIDDSGTEVDAIYIGAYESTLIETNQYSVLSSLPNMVPVHNIVFKGTNSAAREMSSNKGSGWHLMTNWEWAAILLYTYSTYNEVSGGSENGGSLNNNFEFGREVFDEIIGFNTDRIVYTGSGPASWRHDGTYHGISDLVGNVPSWVDGLKLSKLEGASDPQGRILFPEANYFNIDSYPESSWLDTRAAYHADDSTTVDTQTAILRHVGDSYTVSNRGVKWINVGASSNYTNTSNVSANVQELMKAACLDLRNFGNDESYEVLSDRHGVVLFTEFSNDDDEKYAKRGSYHINATNPDTGELDHKESMGLFNIAFHSNASIQDDSGARLAYIPV